MQASAALTEETKMEAEFFDNKVCGVSSLRNWYVGRYAIVLLVVEVWWVKCGFRVAEGLWFLSKQAQRQGAWWRVVGCVYTDCAQQCCTSWRDFSI